jgi:hypothetical protein
MAEPLSREEFERRARKVMENAPAGLSQDEFKKYILDHVDKPEATPGVISDEAWAKMTTKEKLQSGLKWAGHALSSATGMGDAFNHFVDDEPEHPYITTAELATPIAGRFVGPLMRPLVGKAAELAENPLVGGSLGALEEARRGGGPLEMGKGALYGAAGGSLIGRLLRAADGRFNPKVKAGKSGPNNTGGRVVPKSTVAGTQAAEEALQEILADKSPVVTVGSGGSSLPPQAHAPSTDSTVETVARQRAQGQTVNPNVLKAPPDPANKGGRLAPKSPVVTPEDAIARTLEQLRQPGVVDIAPSHPLGGGFTTPGAVETSPVNPNAGGKLGGRAPTVEDEITSALNDVRNTKEPTRTVTQPPSTSEGRRTGAWGQGEITDDTMARLERLEKYGLPDDQQKTLDAYRAMRQAREAEAKTRAATSRVVEKAKNGGGKAVEQEVKTKAAGVKDRLSKVVAEVAAQEGPLAPVASHPTTTTTSPTVVASAPTSTRVKMNATGDEYAGVRESGGPFAAGNRHLTPEEQAAADQFWEEIANSFGRYQ